MIGQIVWKLKDYLQDHRLKPRQVETEAIRLGYRFGRNTIYRLLQGEGPAKFDRHTLAAVVSALRSLTKEPVEVSDLISIEPEAASQPQPVPKALDAELQALLQAATAEGEIIPAQGKPKGVTYPPRLKGAPATRAVLEERETQ